MDACMSKSGKDSVWFLQITGTSRRVLVLAQLLCSLWKNNIYQKYSMV